MVIQTADDRIDLGAHAAGGGVTQNFGIDLGRDGCALRIVAADGLIGGRIQAVDAEREPVEAIGETIKIGGVATTAVGDNHGDEALRLGVGDQIREPGAEGGFAAGKGQLAGWAADGQWSGGNSVNQGEHPVTRQHDAAGIGRVIEDGVTALATKVAILVEVIVNGYREVAVVRLHEGLQVFRDSRLGDSMANVGRWIGIRKS